VRRPWPRWQDTWRRLADRPESTRHTASAYQFLWCWALVFLVFYSFSATKLPNYILPSVLPLAVLVARFWDRWRLVQLAPPVWLLRVGVICLGGCGILIAGMLLVMGGVLEVPYLRTRQVPGLMRWTLLGAVPVAGCAAGLWLLRRDRRTAFVFGFTASVVVFFIPIAAWVIMSFEQVKAPHALVAQAEAAQPRRDIRLACYQMDYLPSLNFYSRRDVEQYKKEQDVVDFLATPLPAYVFVPEDQWRELRSKLPGSYRVIGRHPDFYRGGDVLVVANE
jgi:hypothetical protein